MAKRMQRWVLKKVVPRTKLFSAFLKIGRACRSVLPASLAELIPQRNLVPDWPPASHKRKMLVLQGCVQSAATPEVNAVLAKLLDQLGISLIYAKQAGCCGALEHHLADEDATHTRIRHLIDAWWPEVEAGIESIVVTASGCGVMVKDFGRMLAHDQLYADKAAQISALSLDASELLDIELRDWKQMESCHRVAWHSPCTLQHGQKIVGTVESLLLRSGAHLTTVAEAHLCCGSAGTYSLLEPEFSDKLLERKIGNLTLDDPQVILTANIGCQMHLAKATRIPVRHWIEYLADQYINGL
jgi:glycolate oxidase iron-sulfur subunit